MNRILIVEDDPADFRRFSRPLLNEGFEIEGASNLAEAMQLLQAAGVAYDAAIVDIKLDETDPGNTDGFSVAGKISRMENPFPVLLISRYFADNEYTRRAKEVGVLERYFRDKIILQTPDILVGLVYDALNNHGLSINEFYLYRDRPIGIPPGQGGGATAFFHRSQILYLESAGNNTLVHTNTPANNNVRHQTIIRGYSLGEVHRRLRRYHRCFVRCGNNRVVNVEAVTRKEGQTLYFNLENGEEIYTGLTPSGSTIFNRESCLM